MLLLAVMAINWLILVGEGRILKYASPQVNDYAERVLGMLFAALATQFILSGLAEAGLSFLHAGQTPLG